MLERKIIIILAFLSLLLLTGCLGGDYFQFTETDDGIEVTYNEHKINNDTYIYRNGEKLGKLNQYKDGGKFKQPGLYEIHRYPKELRGRTDIAIKTYNLEKINTSNFDYFGKKNMDKILTRAGIKEMTASFTLIGCNIKSTESISKNRSLVEYQCNPLHYLSQEYKGFIKDEVSNKAYDIEFKVNHGNNYTDTKIFNRSNISKEEIQIGAIQKHPYNYN